jgi:hypothetical protein
MDRRVSGVRGWRRVRELHVAGRHVPRVTRGHGPISACVYSGVAVPTRGGALEHGT